MSSRSPSTVSSPVRRIALPDPPGVPRNSRRTERQPVLLEHDLHRLQVELRRRGRAPRSSRRRRPWWCRFGDVAVDQMVVEVGVRLQMPLQIHGHESAELHEARIHPRPPPGYRRGTDAMRWRSNQAIGRPMARSLTSVGFMRASIGPAIRVRVRGWARSGSPPSPRSPPGPDARLAHREDVRTGTERLDKADEVRDVVFEAEGPSLDETSRALCQSVM